MKDSPVTSGNLAEYYDGAYYETSVFQKIMKHPGKYRAWARISAWIRRDIPPTADILEYGAGPGYNLAALPNTVRDCYDISAAARACCQQHGLKTYESTDQIPRDAYDVVICSHVLEHTPNPEQTLSLLHSFLRPDGLLDLMLPVERYLRIPGRLEPDYHQHLFTWSPQNIVNLLALTGFRAERIRYLPMAGRYLLWRLCGAWPGAMLTLLRIPALVLPRKHLEMRVTARKAAKNQAGDQGCET